MSLPTWSHLVRQCLLHRTNGDEFQELADFLNEKHRLPGKPLVKIILDCRKSFCPSNDPLVPHYVHAIVALGLADLSDALFVLIHNWNDPGHRASEEQTPGTVSGPDIPIVLDLASTAASGNHQESAHATRKSLIITSRWLSALVKWVSEKQEQVTVLPTMTLLEAVGILLVSIASNRQGMTVLEERKEIEPRRSVKEGLNACLPFMANISMQLHARMDSLQKHFDLFEEAPTKSLDHPKADTSQMDVLRFESTLGGANFHARASLFVYFQAALCGRPIIDDHRIMSFLNARYGGDHASMFIDLICSVFDILEEANMSNELIQDLTIYHAFLTNKLPPLLLLISTTSLEPISSEQCISQALNQVNAAFLISPRPTLDPSRRHSDDRVIRQRFLFACALHKLLPETSIPKLLGETPTQTPPAHGLFARDDLVAQIKSNPSRVDALIRELGTMEGNSGPIALALVEVMHRQCQSKETVALKDLCTSLIRKPQSIDIITLFQSPAFILRPLCALLDNWKWDDLHGESQPVYDEFGRILLLVLTFTHRLNLDVAKLGASGSSSFVHRLVEQNSAEQQIGDLDETSSRHLGEWISALFNADILSDELTSSCSPQEFYHLVPTLFSQSLEACECGKLSLESLKSGFDYLLEPFLLPSLVIALEWLSHRMWESEGDKRIVIQLLQHLTKPPNSPEARAMHQTILGIVAAPLQQNIEFAMKRENIDASEMKAVLVSLEPYVPFRTSTFATESQIKSWTSSAGGILTSIRQVVQALVYWSTSIDTATAPPPSFTYKQIDAAIQFHGATSVLHALLDELKSLAGTSNYFPAVDIISSIICARAVPLPTSSPLFTLREALKLEHDELVKAIERGDKGYAEAVVRVYRCVEALSVVPPQTETSIDAAGGPIIAELTNMDLQDIDLGATAGDAEIDVVALGNAPEAQPEDIDKMLDAAAAAPVIDDVDFGADALDVGDSMDDVFAGLGDSGDMGMVNFDDLDMEGMF